LTGGAAGFAGAFAGRPDAAGWFTAALLLGAVPALFDADLWRRCDFDDMSAVLQSGKGDAPAQGGPAGRMGVVEG
jgi:hypothetical protein